MIGKIFLMALKMLETEFLLNVVDDHTEGFPIDCINGNHLYHRWYSCQLKIKEYFYLLT